MQWNQVGQIRFQEDGSPVLVPFPDSVFLGEKSPYSLTKTVEEGLNTFVFDTICDLAGGLESSYRAIGALGNASSALAARTSAGCRGLNPGPTTVDPGFAGFRGGQCETEYSVLCRLTTNDPVNAPGLDLAARVQGPISGVERRPNPFNEQFIILGGPTPANPSGEVVVYTGTLGFNNSVAISSVSRVDGGPDDCGDPEDNPSLPEPDPLPPPVNIGDVLLNPRWVNVSIDDRDNSPTFSLPIGQVVFGGQTGAEFNIGDIPVRILPDWQVQVGSGRNDDGEEIPSLPPRGDDAALAGIAKEIDQLDGRLLDQLEDMERDLEAVGEGLSGLLLPIEGAFTVLDCESEVLEFPFAGRGITGLASMVNAGTLALQATPALICDREEEGPLGPLVLAIAGAVEGAFESRVIAFGQDVRRVVLVVDPGDNADIYRFDNQLTMGRFGWWGVGPIYDGVPAPLQWQQVTLTQQAFDVRQRGWGMRLTLNRGVGYSVFVQEV